MSQARFQHCLSFKAAAGEEYYLTLLGKLSQQIHSLCGALRVHVHERVVYD